MRYTSDGEQQKRQQPWNEMECDINEDASILFEYTNTCTLTGAEAGAETIFMMNVYESWSLFCQHLAWFLFLFVSSFCLFVCFSYCTSIYFRSRAMQWYATLSLFIRLSRSERVPAIIFIWVDYYVYVEHRKITMYFMGCRYFSSLFRLRST